ncbi:PHOsphatase [Mortierella sp. AD032]|nr:PHOsphatase [Mortierella sp. AD032]
MSQVISGPGLSTKTRRARAATAPSTLLLPSVALFLAVSGLFGPSLVQAASVAAGAGAVVFGRNPLVERSTVLGNGYIQPQTQTKFPASMSLNHETAATSDQDSVPPTVAPTHVMPAVSAFSRDGTVVVFAEHYRDSNGSGMSGGGDGRRPAGYSVGAEGTCASTFTMQSAKEDIEVGEHKQELHVPAIAEIEGRLVQLPYMIGREQSPKAKGSSPLYSLPPMDWIRSHLGTKSPYPHESRPVGQVKDTPKGYELVQIHLIVRHGTRFPSSSKSMGFKALADRLKGVKLRGFEWLRDWPSEMLYPPSRGNLLSAQGDADLYQIGRRFAIRYEALLQKYPYDASTYQFYSSAKSRCSQSAYAFSVGLFEGRLTPETGYESSHRPPIQPIEISMLPIGLDKEMAVKYACPRWLESVKDQPGVVKESRLFESKFIPALAERLTAVLSAGAATPSAIVNITAKDAATIQNICGFEIAMHNNDQTWCRLLSLGIEPAAIAAAAGTQKSDTKTMFKNFEIAGDLDDYYTHGPGVPFNRHLGCKLGTSLKENIESVLLEGGSSTTTPIKKRGDDDEEGPKKYRGIFKFGHSETILFFSDFLGLYSQKGVPLTADMTAEQYGNREFKTSKVSPFAANMAFEVYRPTAAMTPNKRRRLGDDAGAAAAPEGTTATPRGLIRLLVNEAPMLIPGCGGKYFCEWPTFKKILEQAGSGCDFDGCCSTLLPQPGPAPAPASVARSFGFKAAAVSLISHDLI